MSRKRNQSRARSPPAHSAVLPLALNPGATPMVLWLRLVIIALTGFALIETTNPGLEGWVLVIFVPLIVIAAVNHIVGAIRDRQPLRRPGLNRPQRE